jgi:hypothetical protein
VTGVKGGCRSVREAPNRQLKFSYQEMMILDLVQNKILVVNCRMKIMFAY